MLQSSSDGTLNQISGPHTMFLVDSSLHRLAVSDTIIEVHGTWIGLTVSPVIPESVTAASDEANKSSPNALMAEFRAILRASFVCMGLIFLTRALCLRRVGRIRVQQD